MSAIFAAVPNFSEGRNVAVIDELAAAARAAGAAVLHRTSDPIHHRSVITLAGDERALLDAVSAMAALAARRIDLRTHRGAHPRMGALDVLPFVPLHGATQADAVALAKRAGARIWRESAIPSILYGAAASASHRADLAAVRAGEFAALPARLALARWAPDFGTGAPHPSAGAIAIGARDFLIAYNLELDSGDLALAQDIARRLRARNGGLRTLKTLAIRLDERRVQVSCNLTDAAATPLYRVTELVRSFAAAQGVALLRAELIGLAPLRAVVQTAMYYAGADLEPNVVFTM